MGAHVPDQAHGVAGTTLQAPIGSLAAYLRGLPSGVGGLVDHGHAQPLLSQPQGRRKAGNPAPDYQGVDRTIVR
jgi:hypothetical protein